MPTNKMTIAELECLMDDPDVRIRLGYGGQVFTERMRPVHRKIWYGFCFSFRFFGAAFGYHTLQCDQRWYGLRFLRGRRSCILGYRTHGDATPNILTYFDAGFWWPWETNRTFSGRRF